MTETEGLKKDMAVGFGQNQYKAISEAAVLNTIKPLLKKYKIILMPTKIEVENWKDEFNTKNGESTRLITQVKAQYKIIDIESGEFELLETVGHGVDTQDKASGKAMTYAYKALLQKTFCMFSGEDTDNEHSEDITNRQTKPQSKATSQSSTATVTEAQLKRLYAIAKTKGFTADQIKAAALKDYDREPKEMDRTMYDRLVDRLEKAGN